MNGYVDMSQKEIAREIMAQVATKQGARLLVFTNEESKPVNNTDLHCLIYRKNHDGELTECIFESSEKMLFCECSNCIAHKAEIAEFASLILALSKIEELKLRLPIQAIVSSQKLGFSIDFFEAYFGMVYQTESCQLINLALELFDILMRLNVAVTKFSDAEGVLEGSDSAATN